ncbi:hypothetical protein, partial [Bacteroides acidifaciens]|uniref:hypothetical protein n=1 Tax=Bacteroides acidifaciens TaxID=85831 RepID=UPI0025A670E0
FRDFYIVLELCVVPYISVIRADIESVKDEIKQMISRIHANELLANRIEQSEKKIIELTSTVNQIAKYINTMNNM